MNKTKFVIPLLALSSALAKAEVRIGGHLSGSASVRVAEVTKHRKSLDCYTFGKGDSYQYYEAQTLGFDAELSMVGSGSLAWQTSMATPFQGVPRRTVLNSVVTSNQGADQVSITLGDVFKNDHGQIHSEKCRHTDGTTSVNDAVVKGTLKVQYVVPANVWAVKVLRVRNSGSFALKNIKSISHVFNEGYDLGKTNEVILWVKPGQILEQEIEIPESVGGADLGELKMIFAPVGAALQPSEIIDFLKAMRLQTNVPVLNPAQTESFLKNTLGVVRAGADLSIYTKNFTLRDLKVISDNFFFMARGVYDHNPQGHAVKVAAAMAAFQITQSILIEMQSYCKDVDVYLPFSGEKQQVRGLQAASFWLSRSMGFVKTYSYEPLIVYLQNLQSLQNKGMTPAMISKDKVLRAQLQKAYQVLTATMSLESGPLNRAYVDFNKMSETFKNIQSLGPQQATLLASLKEANLAEAEFVSHFAKTMAQLRPNNEAKLNYDQLLTEVGDLKSRQSVLTAMMRDSVRLLSVDYSEDSSQIINQIGDLLNHQVNIFKNKVDVPYFDGIRAAFYESNVKDLDGVAQGCFDLEGVK